MKNLKISDHELQQIEGGADLGEKVAQAIGAIWGALASAAQNSGAATGNPDARFGWTIR